MSRSLRDYCSLLDCRVNSRKRDSQKTAGASKASPRAYRIFTDYNSERKQHARVPYFWVPLDKQHASVPYFWVARARGKVQRSHAGRQTTRRLSMKTSPAKSRWPSIDEDVDNEDKSSGRWTSTTMSTKISPADAGHQQV